jgi:hypothetical protein
MPTALGGGERGFDPHPLDCMGSWSNGKTPAWRAGNAGSTPAGSTGYGRQPATACRAGLLNRRPQGHEGSNPSPSASRRWSQTARQPAATRFEIGSTPIGVSFVISHHAFACRSSRVTPRRCAEQLLAPWIVGRYHVHSRYRMLHHLNGKESASAASAFRHGPS